MIQPTKQLATVTEKGKRASMQGAARCAGPESWPREMFLPSKRPADAAAASSDSQAKQALSGMSILGSRLSPKNTLLSGAETCTPLPDERGGGCQVGCCTGNSCGAGGKQWRRPSRSATSVASIAARKMNGMDIAHGSLIIFHFIQPCYLLTSYQCQKTEIPSAC